MRVSSIVMSKPCSLHINSINLVDFQSSFFCRVAGESLECSDDMVGARFLNCKGVSGRGEDWCWYSCRTCCCRGDWCGEWIGLRVREYAWVFFWEGWGDGCGVNLLLDDWLLVTWANSDKRIQMLMRMWMLMRHGIWVLTFTSSFWGLNFLFLLKLLFKTVYFGEDIVKLWLECVT